MRAAIFSFSARGAELSKKVAEYLHSIGYETELQTVAKYAEQTGIAPMLPNHNGACAAVFNKCQALVYVGAVGIAVRTIAPFIKSKLTDPAVISVDERGSFVIPLLAGHIGGANELSRCLAAALGATACVTTATDVNGLFAVDEWAARNRMVLCSLAAAKDFAAALVATAADWGWARVIMTVFCRRRKTHCSWASLTMLLFSRVCRGMNLTCLYSF